MANKPPRDLEEGTGLQPNGHNPNLVVTPSPHLLKEAEDTTDVHGPI